ncbi:MAG: mechanosensitive ion channel family protein, partial [Candidatus Bilamarchaeaceae archaeon]
VLIYVFGLIILLNKLGIEISAFVAGLGIAGLAVALALQDTLANFFAGVYILADKPIKPGDYIRLEEGGGIEGNVEEVGWRSTRIRTSAGNIVFVPNSKMATAIITNFYSPVPEMAHTVVIGASYDDEPDKVLASLRAAVNNVARKTGKIKNPDSAIIRPDKFGESSIDYKIIVKIPTYMDKYPVQGELVREIYYQFKKDGITIPFPTRTLYLEGSGSEKKEFKARKGRKA